MQSLPPSPSKKQASPTLSLYVLVIALPLLACHLIYVGFQALATGRLSIDMGSKRHHLYTTVSRVGEPEKFWGFWLAGAIVLVVITGIVIAAIFEIRRRRRLRSHDVAA
jgi:hypothetical protein